MRIISLLLLGILCRPALAEDSTYEVPKTDSGAPLFVRAPIGNDQDLPKLTPEGNRRIKEISDRISRGERVNVGKEFARFLKIDREKIIPWVNYLAGLLSERGSADRTRARIQMFKAYNSQHPETPEGEIGLGESSWDGEDFSGALAAYTRAIELGAVSPGVFYSRGMAADRLGDHEAAHQDAATVLQMDSANAQARALYKLTHGRPSKIHLDLKTGLPLTGPTRTEKTSPSIVRLPASPTGSGPKTEPTPQPILQSAEATMSAKRHLKVGDMKSAISAARRAINLNPNNSQAHNLLATAHVRRGENKSAIEAADKALELDPGSVPALNTRAWAENGLRRFKAALGDASKLLASNPYNAFGHVNRARALGGLGRRGEMREALRQAARLDGRFEPLSKRALQLADDSDTELLFSGILGGPPAAPAKRRPSRNKRFVLLVLGCLLGGLLIAAGALHIISPTWRERVQTTLRNLRRGAPLALSDAGGPPGYEIKRVIATGGMGVVYEAIDKKLDRRVAAKKLRGEIRSDAKERARFLKEAKTVAALIHPNIVQIHSILEHGEDIYLIFEYVEGETLREILSKRKQLPWKEVFGLFEGICRALEYAHERNVVHRDLKPSNIMIDSFGTPKVMDFGVARCVKDALTRSAMTNTVWGTPSYMAPEAEEGEIHIEGDVYALGVCLYELLTGRPPFTGSPNAIYRAKTEARFTSPSDAAPGVPRELDEILAKALDPNPHRRHHSAGRFWAALREIE